VKWSIFLGLTLSVGLYLLLGYMHAKRRLRKGLMPLAYHRVRTSPDKFKLQRRLTRLQWLVSRREISRVNPRYGYSAGPVGYSTYRPDYYGMEPMPPPVYDPNATRPPVYEGPEGGTKTAPSQWPTHRPEMDDFAPPPGPPPPAVTAVHTGSSNNPFRQ